MNDRNEYIKSIGKVAQALGTATEKEAIFQLIVKSAVETMTGKGAALFLATDETRELQTCVCQTGLSKGYLHSTPSKMTPKLKILQRDGFIHIRDVRKDANVSNRESKIKEGIGSILNVPVRVRGKMIGSLALYTADARNFSEKEIDFLTVLAEQGGLAIVKADFVEKLRNTNRIFLDMASQIAASTDIKTILQTLTEDIAKAMRVKGATIRLMNENHTELRLAASYGLSEKYLNKGPVSPEKSIAMALQGKPVAVKDASTDPRVQFHDEKKQEGIVTILSVPIKSRDEVIGVLRLYSSTSRDFNEDEIQFVTAIAYMGGVAIQNMNLYAMLKDDVKDLRENAWIFRSWF